MGYSGRIGVRTVHMINSVGKRASYEQQEVT